MKFYNGSYSRGKISKKRIGISDFIDSPDRKTPKKPTQIPNNMLQPAQHQIVQIETNLRTEETPNKDYFQNYVNDSRLQSPRPNRNMLAEYRNNTDVRQNMRRNLLKQNNNSQLQA